MAGSFRLSVVPPEREALALEAEEGGVEDREVLPRVLEVDADQLGGDLELHQREPGVSPGLTRP